MTPHVHAIHCETLAAREGTAAGRERAARGRERAARGTETHPKDGVGLAQDKLELGQLHQVLDQAFLVGVHLRQLLLELAQAQVVRVRLLQRRRPARVRRVELLARDARLFQLPR